MTAWQAVSPYWSAASLWEKRSVSGNLLRSLASLSVPFSATCVNDCAISTRNIPGGNFRLRDARGPFRTNSDIIRFARITRVAHYFPALDPKLLSVLLDSGQDSPCIIWNAPPRQAPALFGGFQVIIQAIISSRRIHFLHHGHHQSAVAPYRLICLEGEWYLTAVTGERIQVFTLSAITDVVMTIGGFTRSSHIRRIFEDPRFIQALPHFQYISGLIRE
ncbi:transcriptional regulator [Klebsiella variicola]|nr:transcriptional regulator [Klebsiella variicola]